LRIIADEMISPKIVRTVSDTVLSSGLIFDSVYHAKLTGKPDEDWIMTFARAGGNVFISADQRMLKREALLQGIADTGLIGIYLPSMWAASPRDTQLAYFIHWWRKIEATISATTLGSAWVVPRGLGGGELRQHKAMENVQVRKTTPT
jgi:hypothetical protein